MTFRYKQFRIFFMSQPLLDFRYLAAFRIYFMYVEIVFGGIVKSSLLLLFFIFFSLSLCLRCLSHTYICRSLITTICHSTQIVLIRIKYQALRAGTFFFISFYGCHLLLVKHRWDDIIIKWFNGLFLTSKMTVLWSFCYVINLNMRII